MDNFWTRVYERPRTFRPARTYCRPRIVQCEERPTDRRFARGCKRGNRLRCSGQTAIYQTIAHIAQSAVKQAITDLRQVRQLTGVK